MDSHEQVVNSRKKRNKIKKPKSKGNSGMLNGKNVIMVGLINDEARNLIPSLGNISESHGESKTYVVSRKSPNPDISLSIKGNGGGGASIGEVSIGDSEIRVGNERNLVEHEISVAKKVWSFAKENLGVTGKRKDEEYTGRIRNLEARDQNAKGRKEKKNRSQ